MEAIRSELDRAGTVIFGAPSELDARLAERLAALIPSAEMVRFTNSGTEATMHALRIARGATGRTRVVKFEGHYHGSHDSVLANLDRPLPAHMASDGIPPAVSSATIVLPLNDLDAAARALEEPDIAAVIVEPIARGAIQADAGFLPGLRDLTRRRGVVLIFDEVVTWPRVSMGGAQALLGVTPDLTALGKAIGGGLPMGAVVGKRELMEVVAPPASRGHSPAGAPARYVFHGGTYNGTPAAVAAGLAVLDLLEEDGVYDRWLDAGERMRAALRELFLRRGVTAQVIGAGSLFDFYFTAEPVRSLREVWTSDLEARRVLDYRLLVDGIYNSPLHRFHLSLAHSELDSERTLQAIDRAMTNP
jgi:glutamate-1-semialdehyde 2,1-aminomutase